MEQGRLQHEAEVALPPMPLGEEVVNDYQSLSFSLKAHPMAFLRKRLDRTRCVPSVALQTMRTGARVKVAGLVLVRQRPGSAKGVIFETIEDETGVANLIVWPKTFEKYRAIVLGSRCVGVIGKLQKEEDVIHVVVEHMEDLMPMLSTLTSRRIEDLGQTSNADEATKPGMDARDKERTPARLKRLMRTYPSRQDGTASAMPRGRNFH